MTVKNGNEIRGFRNLVNGMWRIASKIPMVNSVVRWVNHRLVRRRRGNLKHLGLGYENITISNSLEESFHRYGIEVRRPYQSRCKRDRHALIWIGTKEAKKHRFSTYYYDLADKLNSEDTILLGKSIRDAYWEEYNPFEKDDAIDRFKLIIGYHDSIEPKCSIEKTEQVIHNAGYSIQRIRFIGRFGVPFYVYCGIPDTPVKGILLAVHGRSSGPDNVIGLGDDYSRSFGEYWLRNGYTVYAPQVDWNLGLPMERLNYSSHGADLAKLVDVLRYIKSVHTADVPVITAGISYGAMLSEMLGIISPDIDAVISIGGNAREDQFDRYLMGNLKVNPEELYDILFLPPSYYFYYHGIGLYHLLCPKPLVISVGTHDRDEDKFKAVFHTMDYYKSYGYADKIAVNVFYGFHEADPEGELRSFEKLVESGAFK